MKEFPSRQKRSGTQNTPKIRALNNKWGKICERDDVSDEKHCGKGDHSEKGADIV